MLGKYNEIVTELCKELGWKKELLGSWEKTEASVLKFENDEPKETVQAEKTEAGVLKFENDEPKETVQAE